MRSVVVGGLVIASVLATAEAARAQAFAPLPFEAPGILLDAGASEASFSVDAGTLPARSRMITSVVPGGTHPDLELEVAVDCTWLPLLGSGCNEGPMGMQLPYSSAASFAPGPAEYDANFVSCNPYSPFPGESCQVTVRALDFGAAGPPATVDVEIRAYTQVPTSTLEREFDPVPEQATITFRPTRDTTLYSENVGWSNGQGESVWAGRNYLGGFPVGIYSTWHGMLTFEVGAPLAPTFGRIPPNATIDDAVLTLHVLANLGGVSTVTLSPVDDRDGNPFSPDRWFEGDADAAGDEQAGAVSAVQSADWEERQSPFSDWNTPGAGTGSIVATGAGPVAGQPLVFQSAALTSEIDRQYSTGDDDLGFQLRTGTFLPFLNTDQGVRFASDEHASPGLRPELVVFYTPEFAAPLSEDLFTGAINFIDEGEDFRWIYDDDGDDVLLTDIGGRCVETLEGPENDLWIVPYEYTFEGDPAYVGLDCCTWQITSLDTGTVGAGQAIFFLNLDASDPANQPGDFDGDGIRDLCDNCAYHANGPLLGTCVGPAGPYPEAQMQVCRSDLECPAGDYCSLSQEDDDFALPGIACPEPGLGAGLALGAFGLAGGLGRARRVRRDARRRG